MVQGGKLKKRVDTSERKKQEKSTKKGNYLSFWFFFHNQLLLLSENTKTKQEPGSKRKELLKRFGGAYNASLEREMYEKLKKEGKDLRIVKPKSAQEAKDGSNKPVISKVTAAKKNKKKKKKGTK